MKPIFCTNATAARVMSVAPNAVSRLIEWHAYDCGCVYRITVGVTDPQRYVAAVVKADKTGEV